MRHQRLLLYPPRPHSLFTKSQVFIIPPPRLPEPAGVYFVVFFTYIYLYIPNWLIEITPHCKSSFCHSSVIVRQFIIENSTYYVRRKGPCQIDVNKEWDGNAAPTRLLIILIKIERKKEKENG